MIFLKWFLIILVSIDFIADFAVKCKGNKKIAEWIGSSLGFIARSYVIYILITVWNV